jgi:hypothetical protein
VHGERFSRVGRVRVVSPTPDTEVFFKNSVVFSAVALEVSGMGGAARMGHGVIDVGVQCRTITAWVAARQIPNSDELIQCPRRAVLRLWTLARAADQLELVTW